MYPKIFSILKTCCVFAIVFFISSVLSLDQKFEACEPNSCGLGPNISYPFWISEAQESYCGIPNFEIACRNDYPLLRISNDEYFIKEIFPSNHSFLLVSAAAYEYEEHTCPTPLHNISLDRTSFNMSPGYANLTLFYNCSTPTLPATYPIDCASNDTSHSFATFHTGLLVSSYEFSTNSCLYIVHTPLFINGYDASRLESKNITQILEIGFFLNWTAQDCTTCRSSGGRCGFENNNFICYCPDGSDDPESCHPNDRRNVKAKVIIGVCAGVGGALIGGALLVCIVRQIVHQRRKKNIFAPTSWKSRSVTASNTSSKSKFDIEKSGSEFKGIQVHLFSYNELEEATNHFHSANELGDGGFGTVYKGKLQDKRVVAVKRLYENNYKRVEQFMNEVEILTGLRHPNLVSLYGCTSRHSRELLLVYEFISNGTVADHLHGNRKKNGGLPWSIRMKIAVETATALAYLHASDIIHRDVKTNNILLDHNFIVKVADFGLSRLFPTHVTHISTAPQGTPGYVDPEYHECYQLTVKSDVYSFGVVLVELVSSLPAVDITRHRHEINLSNMAINKIQTDALHELVDKNLGYDSDYQVRKMINAVAELAFQCLQSAKEMRPSMEDVLENLKNIQGREHNTNKKEESEVQSDHVGLLNGQIPPSPDTITTQWSSSSYSTTSNISG